MANLRFNPIQIGSAYEAGDVVNPYLRAKQMERERDAEMARRALEARQILPAENRRALFEEISAAMGLEDVATPFAEAVPVPGDAPAIDRLVAWNGRDPRRWS